MKAALIIAASLMFAACATTGDQGAVDAKQRYENEKYYHPNCTHIPEGTATHRQCVADENHKDRKERERQHNRQLLKQQQDPTQDIRSLGNTKNLGL